VPDRPGPARGEHHAAVERTGPQPARPVLGDGERAVRGERGHAQCGADVEAGLVGQRCGPLGGHDCELGGGAGGPPGGGHEEPDPLADPVLVDPFTDGVDHAGAVEVRGDLGELFGVGGAGAGLPVGRVDPGHGDPDANLAGAWHGQITLDELKNVGAAVVAVDDGFHDPSLEAGRYGSPGAAGDSVRCPAWSRPLGLVTGCDGRRLVSARSAADARLVVVDV
jgi:hypothetical protein